MSTSFSQQLRSAAQPTWDDAVNHRFVDELIGAEIDDAVMAGYLIQDHRFLDAFLALLGAGIATSDSPAARLRLGRFAGMISSKENTYFLRAFEALGVSEEQRRSTPDAEPTAGFIAIMAEAAETRSYPAVLAVLTVTEWLYQDWAARAPQHPVSENFVHTEWIGLHNNPDFVDFVGFLRDELDRAGPTEADTAADFFHRTVMLELEFFNALYTTDTPR